MIPADPLQFLRKIDGQCDKQIDRALALIWFVGVDDHALGCTARDIASLLRDAGHAQQNVHRLDTTLATDRRTVAAKGGGHSLRLAARRNLDEIYKDFLGPTELPKSDSIIPMELVGGTRGYIEKVADQANKSYDTQLYDCAAVMCRRLLETLIIETYEHQGREDEIKNGRNYLGLAELIAVLDADRAIPISKPAMNALKDFKRLGDLSAHNRHFNARIGDIEGQRMGIRLVVEEMLYRAGLHPSSSSAVA
jgi:hypothetical protein